MIGYFSGFHMIIYAEIADIPTKRMERFCQQINKLEFDIHVVRMNCDDQYRTRCYHSPYYQFKYGSNDSIYCNGFEDVNDAYEDEWVEKMIEQRKILFHKQAREYKEMRYRANKEDRMKQEAIEREGRLAVERGDMRKHEKRMKTRFISLGAL